MARKRRRAEDIAAGAPSANESPVAEPGENIIPATDETVPVSEDAGGAAPESLARPYSENFRMFAREAADYSKNCFETRATYSKALLTAKSLENAVQFQNSYAKSAYAGLMAHLLKMNVLYFSLLGEAARQVTPLVTKAYGAKT